jgi:hypothetical protein
VFQPSQAYPQMPSTGESGAEADLSRQYADREQLAFQRSMQSMLQFYVDRTNRVDEYRVQSLAGESLSLEQLQPDYECDEVIESILVTGPTAAIGNSQSTEGTTAVAPAAGTTITSQLYASQNLQIQWSVELGGTATAADANNFGLYNNATLIATSENPGTVGVPYPQETLVNYQALNNLNTIAVKNIAAGSAAATYSAQLTITTQPQPAPFTLKLGKRAWNLLLPASGVLVIAPVAIKLSRSDDRYLIAPTPGDWSMELMGYAETGRRGIV